MLLKQNKEGGEDQTGAESQSYSLARRQTESPAQNQTATETRGKNPRAPELALGKHIYLVHTRPPRWRGLCQLGSDCKPEDYREGDLRKKALPSLNLGCLGHHK